MLKYERTVPHYHALNEIVPPNDLNITGELSTIFSELSAATGAEISSTLGKHLETKDNNITMTGSKMNDTTI